MASVHGYAVVLAEQQVGRALEIADEAVVLTHGRIGLGGPAADLARDATRLEQAYLGMADQPLPS
jgi:branched-chain amino acid transport system ATP-binding protein